MDSPNFINIDIKDEPIHRIFSKNRFLEILTSQKNGLVHPSKWDDPFENFFLKSRVRGPQDENISMENIAADWYGQCWTRDAETDAMWRIYSDDKNGIKVKSTTNKLFNSFYDSEDKFSSLKFFIGLVKYMTESEIKKFMSEVTFQDIAFGGQATKFAELLCIKREAFKHENEVRILYQDIGERKIATSGVARFKVDANHIFDEVVLDPRLDTNEARRLREEIIKAGYTRSIEQSTLYRIPDFVISL